MINIKIFLISFLFLASFADASEKRQALYHSLDPTSISQHLAFYELYSDTEEGHSALIDAWKLISSGSFDQPIPLSFPHSINTFIALINPDTKTNENFEIPEETLTCIEQVSAHLPNKTLKGYQTKNIDELLLLPSEEIDLSRALLLSQLEETQNTKAKMRAYLATLDLMALQVLVRLPKEATPKDKVRALNQLIFYEMGFRFPPHSTYSSQIDQFTFLPSVLESRKGVCLGVSALYLCLAQRINLPLEIITPPGHIYLRAKVDGADLNIETTLRGVHIRNDQYLGINTKSLEVRTIKEVIGMAHFNQASVWLAKGEWQQAATAYAEALRFTPKDRMTKELYGCSLLLCDKPKEAQVMLQQALAISQENCVSPNSLVADILAGHVGKEGLPALFLYVNETRNSILKKKETLERACARYPRFLSGLFQLAICHLQLQEPSKAIEALEKYHEIDPTDINVEFYLSELYFSRFNAPLCIKHLEKAELIASKSGYKPLALQEFKTHVAKKCL